MMALRILHQALTGEYLGLQQNVAEELEIVSSSNKDKLTGQGARKVRISGLLNAALEITPSVEVELNGTLPVTVPGIYSRASKITVTEVGNLGSNQR